MAWRYFGNDNEIRSVGPKREKQFEEWQELLATSPGSARAESEIRAAINVSIDEKVMQYGWSERCAFGSSQLPSSDWNGTPYQPIYTVMLERYGAELAWDQSRFFFGLLVKDVVSQRNEHWCCYKVQEQEERIKGTFYFPDLEMRSAIAA
ncbi:MAG: hypothetical protein NVS1B11_31250 [Terriglobales bacterium]